MAFTPISKGSELLAAAERVGVAAVARDADHARALLQVLFLAARTTSGLCHVQPRRQPLVRDLKHVCAEVGHVARTFQPSLVA